MGVSGNATPVLEVEPEDPEVNNCYRALNKRHEAETNHICRLTYKAVAVFNYYALRRGI